MLVSQHQKASALGQIELAEACLSFLQPRILLLEAEIIETFIDALPFTLEGPGDRRGQAELSARELRHPLLDPVR